MKYLKFNDLYFNNEEIIIQIIDIKEISFDADDNILIENVDGLFYAANFMNITESEI